MTKSKLIVIWDGEDILSSYIKSFLATQEGWQVVSIANKEGLEALKLAVKTAQPDIVIIHQGYQNSSANLPMQLLQDYPAVKVIAISLENNLMEIFSKQEIWVKQVSDLIGVIENEPYVSK